MNDEFLPKVFIPVSSIRNYENNFLTILYGVLLSKLFTVINYLASGEF